VRVLRGKHLKTWDPATFLALRAPFARVLIDVGAGDGGFAYDTARAEPQTLAIAVEPVADNIQALATKALRKVNKGGAPNVVFVVAALESLPTCLEQQADHLSINYPWGSLLRAVVLPDPDGIRRLLALARPGAKVTLLLNASIFEAGGHAERLDLPPVDEAWIRARVLPAFAQAGVVLHFSELAGDPPYKTWWGRHLVRNSNRSSWMLEGYRSTPQADTLPSQSPASK